MKNLADCICTEQNLIAIFSQLPAYQYVEREREKKKGHD
jgi:hypothetical protein